MGSTHYFPLCTFVIVGSVILYYVDAKELHPIELNDFSRNSYVGKFIKVVIQTLNFFENFVKLHSMVVLFMRESLKEWLSNL